MANAQQGVLSIVVNGERFSTAGEFSYNLGELMNEPIVGEDGDIATSVRPQPGFIEGAVRLTGDMDVRALVTLQDATAELALRSGKRIIGRQLFYASEGTVTVSEGVVPLRLVGKVEEDLA